MKFEEFVKEVMHRANLSSRAQAQEAVRATLETLSEHLTGGEAGHLLDQLDPRLGVYLQQPTGGTAQKFSASEFFQRVSLREGVSLQEATQHARVVAAVLSEAASKGEIEDIRRQLPPDLARLFPVQDQ